MNCFCCLFASINHNVCDVEQYCAPRAKTSSIVGMRGGVGQRQEHSRDA